MKYGDRVKYRMDDQIGTIIGFMHMNTDKRKMLVKFDIKNERWIDEIDLEKVND